MAGEKLEDQGGKFLYLSLRKALADEYASAEYYTPLPSERELCEIYQVTGSCRAFMARARSGRVRAS